MSRSFKELSSNVLEPLSQVVMIIGIIALCQPWSLTLHSYGVTIVLIGLVGFSIFSKIKPPLAPAKEQQTGHG